MFDLYFGRSLLPRRQAGITERGEGSRSDGMEIDHGGTDVFVAHELLDGTHVDAVPRELVARDETFGRLDQPPGRARNPDGRAPSARFCHSFCYRPQAFSVTAKPRRP